MIGLGSDKKKSIITVYIGIEKRQKFIGGMGEMQVVEEAERTLTEDTLGLACMKIQTQSWIDSILYLNPN